MMRSVLLVLLFCAVVRGSEHYFRKLDSLTPEAPCSAAGGICTFATDCPQLTEERNLCPQQRSLGVECCYGVSVRETRCQKLGGHCVQDKCSASLLLTRATDCCHNQFCCTLV